MTLKTLFTAVGRMEKRTDSPGRSYPVIVLGGKDYMVDLQEMLVWSSLNWRIARKNEIGELYNKAVLDYSFQADRTWNACVERLLIRGLLVSGSGATDYDALYDLLSTMYIIPASGSFPPPAVFILKACAGEGCAFVHGPQASLWGQADSRGKAGNAPGRTDPDVHSGNHQMCGKGNSQSAQRGKCA